jgi:hypothetical protein
MGKMSARAGLTAAAAGLALALSAGPVQAAGSSGWQVAYRSSSATADPLSSVTAPSAGDAWAVGVSVSGSTAQPVILHWDGSSWSPVTVPGTSGFRPGLVESSSADDVWVFGYGSSGPQALVWNGSTWSTVALPASFGGGPAAVVNSTDVWAAASSSCSAGTCTTAVWHWDGTSWASSQVNGFLQGITSAGSAAWLVTLTSVHNPNTNPTGQPAIYESAGDQLQPVASPATRIGTDAGLAASPAGQLWLLGPPAASKDPSLLFHWNGQSWSQSAIPAKVSGSSEPFIVNYAPTYDGRRGIWAGPYAHWTGTRWRNTNQTASLPGNDSFALLAVASIPGSASIWAAGWAGRSPSNNTQDSLIAAYGGLP